MTMEAGLTVDQVAERMQVSTPETVRRWLRERRLRGYQVSRQAGWRVSPADLERFINANMSSPDEEEHHG